MFVWHSGPKMLLKWIQNASKNVLSVSSFLTRSNTPVGQRPGEFYLYIYIYIYIYKCTVRPSRCRPSSVHLSRGVSSPPFSSYVRLSVPSWSVLCPSVRPVVHLVIHPVVVRPLSVRPDVSPVFGAQRIVPTSLPGKLCT